MGPVRRAFRAFGATIKWLLIVGALLVVVIVIVAIVGLGNASNESEKSSRKVTPAKLARVHHGASKATVRQILGKPENTDVTDVGGLGRSECWYYGTLAKKTYQLCFENGRLAYKARY